MSKQCEYFEQSGFFKKYQDSKRASCKGFIRRFCKGPEMEQCKRKQYRKEHGFAPSDDMMPSGLMIKE